MPAAGFLAGATNKKAVRASDKPAPPLHIGRNYLMALCLHRDVL